MPCRPPEFQDNTWGDKNQRLSCRRCGVVGIRYGSKTGFCEKCYSRLPQLVKAGARDDFDLARVVNRYIREMVATFGIAEAAKRMDVPEDQLEVDP